MAPAVRAPTRNVTEPGDFLRGFGCRGGAFRTGWRPSAMSEPGIGAGLRARASDPGRQMIFDGRAMIEAAGVTIPTTLDEPCPTDLMIHEMDTARMGCDPRTSVLDAFSQAHEVPNLFIIAGAAMASGCFQNHSLTKMARPARAPDHAVDILKEGTSQ